MTRAQNDIKIDGFPEAARWTNRRSECKVRSVSPGPDRDPSGWVRCITLRIPRSPRPSTCAGVSTATPISSWSSPPGNPVPCAVEPTSTNKIVASGRGGISSTGRYCPPGIVDGSQFQSLEPFALWHHQAADSRFDKLVTGERLLDKAKQPTADDVPLFVIPFHLAI